MEPDYPDHARIRPPVNPETGRFQWRPGMITIYTGLFVAALVWKWLWSVL